MNEQPPSSLRTISNHGRRKWETVGAKASLGFEIWYFPFSFHVHHTSNTRIPKQLLYFMENVL